MYKVESVEISGFWGRATAKSHFNEGVNIIIGDNGSGKTTFMNILYAILSVDVPLIDAIEFSEVHITLKSISNSIRNIHVRKWIDNDYRFCMVEYKISSKIFKFPLLNERSHRERYYYLSEVRGGSPSASRYEDVRRVKSELRDLISLASLTVYRNREAEERAGESTKSDSNEFISPVDKSLNYLIANLGRYQLDLSNKAREVALKLQQNVLLSLLYAGDKKKYPWDNYDEENEAASLRSAYLQLGMKSSQIENRIKFHTQAVSKAINVFRQVTTKTKDGQRAPLEATDVEEASNALDAWIRTKKVIELSLSAEKEQEEIFQDIRSFITIINEFTPHKVFSVERNGDVLVTRNSEKIPISKLSSGEKQLLILLIETLLQRKKSFVFLADEPELSLHISWQRLIIGAVRELNPNAQIIVATHSPEIAGKFRESIIDMESVIHANA